MKTIRNKNSDLKRVSDQEAHRLVTNHGWSYVPKSTWKESTREKKPEK